jgi:uncharacterized protein YdeI (BOF family)
MRKLMICTLLLSLSSVALAQQKPEVLEFVTRTDGWSYPQGNTDTAKLMRAFKADKNTIFYLNGKVVQPKDVCLPCGDAIERFKLDKDEKVFTEIEFKRGTVVKTSTIFDGSAFKLGGN